MVLKPIYEIKIIHSKNLSKDKDVVLLKDEILQNIIDIKIEEDVTLLTNTATIKIPAKNVVMPTKDNNSISFKNENGNLYMDDMIEIRLGYNELLEQVFIGYLVSYEAVSNYIILYLQDYMYFWKKQPAIQFSENAITLKDLLIKLKFNELYDTWEENNIMEFTLPKIRTYGFITPAEVLKMLKDNYKFYAYYLRGKLYVGHKYPLINRDKRTNSEIVYAFDYPYFNFIGTDLGKTIFTSKNQTYSYPILKSNIKKSYNSDKVIVVVTSIDPDNTKILYYMTNETEKPIKAAKIPSKYSGYTTKTINETNLTKEAVSSLCENIFYNYPTHNYNGSFTTFGIPTLFPNDTVLLALNLLENQVDKNTLKDIDINYFIVSKVIRKYSNKGYFQDILLDENYLSNFHINKN